MTWSPTGPTLTPRKGWAGSAGPTTRDPVRGSLGWDNLLIQDIT